MEAQHTPGNWRLAKASINENDYIISSDAMPGILATVHGANQGNANLLVNAPETAAERDRLKERVIKLEEALKGMLLVHRRITHNMGSYETAWTSDYTGPARDLLNND